MAFGDNSLPPLLRPIIFKISLPINSLRSLFGFDRIHYGFPLEGFEGSQPGLLQVPDEANERDVFRGFCKSPQQALLKCAPGVGPPGGRLYGKTRTTDRE